MRGEAALRLNSFSGGYMVLGRPTIMPGQLLEHPLTFELVLGRLVQRLPQLKAMLETSAEVLGGLIKTFRDYELKNEPGWQ